MSEFSELLSLFIKTRDVNVSALTGYCSLDRSTMYKLINGKRTPSSKELVQNIAAFMNLNPVETQELINTYLLTKVGWDTYYRRKNVLEFILDFTSVQGEAFSHFTPPPDFSGFRLSPLNSKESQGNSIPLSGQLQLSSAIHNIFLQEAVRPNGKLCVFAQPEHLEGLNITSSFFHNKHSVELLHILCINNNKSLLKSQQNYNIQCLKKIVPLYGTSCNYQPYYYYDNVNSHFNNLNFMPCLFLTSQAAVLCSNDLKEGVLFKDTGILSMFYKRFHEMLNKTEPLAVDFSSSLELHLKNFATIYKESSDLLGLSAEPCLVPFFTLDLLEKYLYRDLPHCDSLLENLGEYIKSFNRENFHFYFTKDGVRNFLMTGKLHEIPDVIYRPFEMNDRIKLLKRLYKQIENNWDLRLLKGALEKFPLSLHLSIASNYGYMMFSGQSQNLSYILLKEQNILAAFYDFCLSLEENEMLDTKEETLSFLNTLIEESSGNAAKTQTAI